MLSYRELVLSFLHNHHSLVIGYKAGLRRDVAAIDITFNTVLSKVKGGL